MHRPLQTDKHNHKSNSTSSIFYSGTIVEPNMWEVISSVSTMLHCQMMRDIGAPEHKKKILPDFCEEKYTNKVVTEMPPVRGIFDFLNKVFEVGQFNTECCVIMLVYMNRLIGVTGLPLTQSNWKPIAISALVLAQKVWDDTPLVNADFSILYPALGVQQINMLERRFLDVIEFKLSVSPSLYAQYYFELRSICEEGAQTFRPLQRAKLKKLEARSHLSEQYQKRKSYNKARTMTIDQIAIPVKRLVLS
mmetsp:Transcript_31453/g.61335  ORF Transcript_31453/g.61335 Transcript_31453/m.61335 type:complete len:249 (+) Transcript_31453:34-780(+)